MQEFDPKIVKPDELVTDEMIDRVITELNAGTTIREAETRRKQLSKEEWHKLRVRAKFDLFFLAYGVLGYTRLSANLHGNLCEHVVRTEHERFHGYLMPRGTFKTTLLTISDSIRSALPCTKEDLEYNGWWLNKDEKPQELLWPMSLGTDIRLLIGHETHESAARFLFAITNHFTANVVLMSLFPETTPSPRIQRINKHELELPRQSTGNPEPTIDTLGVGGKSQGRHYNRIKLDDIYGDKARDSEAEATTARDWFDNIQSFFSLFSKDKLDLTGTRYSFDDLYAHAMERYGTQMVWYTRKLEEVNPTTGKLEITFPEEFTQESIQIIKKNKRVYEAQYQNDPESGSGGFQKEWLQYFNWLDTQRIAIFTGSAREIINIRDLDTTILIDPGQEKTGGLVINGVDHKKRVFTFVALPLELTPPGLTDLVFKSVVRWLPRTVAIETDFFMSLFEHYWKAEMKIRGIYFHITPVKTKLRPKFDRIEGLSLYYENKQIFHNVAQTELLEEYRRFGKSRNIHILDALAYGPEIWRPGWAPGTRPETFVSESTDNRDVQTGYSVIS